MHPSKPTVAIVGAFSARPDLPAPPPRLTASRWPDLERLLDPASAPTEAVLCAAVLLLHRAGAVRVVLTREVADLPPDVDVVVLPGHVSIETLTFLGALPSRPTLVLDLPKEGRDPPPSPTVRYVRARGSVQLPGRLRRQPASGTTLALPLLLGTPTLLPLCELDAPPLPPDDGTPLLVDLVLRRPPRSGPRVALAPGTLPLFPPRLDHDDALSDDAPNGDATPATPSQPSQATRPNGPSDPAVAGLETALGALTERFAHRLERGPAALATLRREASRLLQAERARGGITGFALSVELAEDQDGADAFVIEAAVTLPRRVGKVILRVVQR
jgi:hypothetical protein